MPQNSRQYPKIQKSKRVVNKRGAVGVEYGLLIGLVSLLGIVGVSALGWSLKDALTKTSDALASYVLFSSPSGDVNQSLLEQDGPMLAGVQGHQDSLPVMMVDEPAPVSSSLPALPLPR